MLPTRLLRALLFDQRLYAELARDPVALAQAVVIVLLASAAAVAGTVITVITDTNISLGEGVVRGVVIMPGIWFVQAVSAFALGRLAQDAGAQRVSRGHLLAAIGYSASPGVLLILLAVQPLREVAGVIVPLWLFLSMAVAVKSALGVSLFRGIMTVVPGLVITLLIGMIVTAVSDSGSSS